MLKWIYLLFCLISIFETIFYTVSTPSKINKKYLYLFSFATLACISYTIGTFGKTLEGLYYANLMYNMGSIMGDIFLLFVISYFAHTFSSFFRSAPYLEWCGYQNILPTLKLTVDLDPLHIFTKIKVRLNSIIRITVSFHSNRCMIFVRKALKRVFD